MGIVFGVISVEVPKHEVLKVVNGVELRKYPAQVAATVHREDVETPSGKRKFTDEAFTMLARYIGVFGTPQNAAKAGAEQSGEKIAMTAPVQMTSEKPEKIAMTAPVQMTSEKSEKIAMTAPVQMTTENSEKVAMTGPVLMTAAQEDETQQKSEMRNTMSFLLPAKYDMDTAPTPTDSRVKLSVFPERTLAALKFSGNLNDKYIQEKRVELVKKLDEMDVKYDASGWSFAGYNPPFTLPWCKTNEILIPVAE